MNYTLSLILLALLSHFDEAKAQRSLVRKGKKTIIEGVFVSGQSPDSLNIDVTIIDYVGNSPEWKQLKQKVVHGSIKWALSYDKPVLIYTGQSWGGDMFYVVEPGDSIRIDYTNGKPSFSGKGADKFRLMYEAKEQRDKLPKPENPKFYVTNSLKDFLEYNDYLNRQLGSLLPLFDRYKNKISDFAYTVIKARVVAEIEQWRTNKFFTVARRAEEFGVTAKDAVAICDSTLHHPAAQWLRSLSDGTDNSIYFYQFTFIQVYKKYNFNFDHDSVNTEAKRRALYYRFAKQHYKGLIRERYLAYLITSHCIKNLGFVPITEELLKDYYSLPGFTAHKKWVRDYEMSARVLVRGSIGHDFTLTDSSGRQVKKDDLLGKTVLMDFWFTGCVGCVQMVPALKQVEENFGRDTNVIFVSVSTDKNKSQWLTSVSKQKYTTGNGINLYTGGLGAEHSMIKNYNISSFPRLYLLDRYGKVAENPLPDPRSDNGKELIEILGHQLVVDYEDGPYVLHEKDSVVVYSFSNSSIIKKAHPNEAVPMLKIHTDQQNRTFNVSLKRSLSKEPAEYPAVERLLALSDIEGNFDAFRNLLQKGGVIDKDLNWTFGSGHLVLVGDFFDRGKQVTECLWLIYALEEKAKAAGGYVHFILGNHELMNLSGDLRYVQQKYIEINKVVGMSYQALWGKDSELGRWLRTKNIMERIGPLLFVHGGISKEVNVLPMTISQINELARSYYAGSTNLSNPQLSTIVGTQPSSPLWCRDYYESNESRRAPYARIDSTLEKFGVSKIITGHTIIADTVSCHFDGKVINTDTHHAEGKSEALLIEGTSYYRINAEGKKQLLFSVRNELAHSN